MKKISTCDIFLGVAAVADYRLEKIATHKMAKQQEVMLKLVPNIDIIAEVASLTDPPFIIGFAAETEDVLNKAKKKLIHKKMDVIIANQVGEDLGMNQDQNEVTLISHHQQIHFKRTDKEKLARQLIAQISQLFNERMNNGKNIGK